MIMVILTLALAATLLDLAYRTAFTVLFSLARHVAFICELLHFAAVLQLTVRIAHAAIVWNLCSQDKQTAELRQLRQVIFNMTCMTALILLLAVGSARISLGMV
ncbi:hypothetical protein QY702_22060 [Xanthomonas campestris pv. plantaginis]|uniref:hypothetical protein n=1 Tax=Xanthomonas campestris TaxID=339 RepID=UPI002B23C977|nr:hypothetical protein [Xanthomonas campestris]MEA9609029.1 hypothetical protein [Xanthomonas campestris pv. plantaginis]